MGLYPSRPFPAISCGDRQILLRDGGEIFGDLNVCNSFNPDMIGEAMNKEPKMTNEKININELYGDNKFVNVLLDQEKSKTYYKNYPKNGIPGDYFCEKIGDTCITSKIVTTSGSNSDDDLCVSKGIGLGVGIGVIVLLCILIILVIVGFSRSPGTKTYRSYPN